MSRPKNTAAYPSTMLDIMERMTRDPTQPLRIAGFLSYGEAKAFRLDFYGFRAAAILEGLDKMYPDMQALRIRSEGNALIIEHRDHTNTAKITQRALDEDERQAG